ncbi:MAG: site-specific integrase, partial [Thermoplasmatota archaeon]
VRRIQPEDMATFHKKYAGLSGGYRRLVFQSTRSFLFYYDNTKALKFKVRIRGYTRERVDWLTPIETEEILKMPVTRREAVLVRGGLLQGMRRIELVRMTARDTMKAIETGVLTVRGKGDKMRSVPLHLGFAEALRAYLEKAVDRDGDQTLLGIARGTAYQTVVSLSVRYGHRFATHTLRRTFGRNLWLRGIPIETIAELMGHASTDMTRLYLGLNITDMRKAITEYGTKSELKIIEEIPQRRIAPPREKDLEELLPMSQKNLEDPADPPRQGAEPQVVPDVVLVERGVTSEGPRL